jgi:alpha/beta superfamily hydrolase
MASNGNVAVTDAKEVTNKVALSPAEIDVALRRFVDGFASPPRSPVFHWPSEHGLEYEDVTFLATDGVPLDAWFIPAPGSNKVIIANHPLGFSRSGIPTQFEPWHAIWAPSGNGFEVDLVPDYKILHDAGYNVLTYDFRNHGLSSAGNGGVVTHGFTEKRDVVGSLHYIRTRPDTQDMIIGLFSRCWGGVSTLAAMAAFPEEFDGVRCLVTCQPITPRYIAQRRLEVLGISDRLDDFNQLLRLHTSIGLEQRVPQEWAKSVRMPTFIYQVHEDTLTEPEDVQAMYDNIPVAEKKLQWIEGTKARWDGYLEFQRRPEPMLGWFDMYMT